jgi:hypothetical protein
MRYKPLILAAAVAIPTIVHAQEAPDSLSLLGRSTISLGLGLTGSRSATADVGRTATHTSGQVAALAFTHWIRPSVAIEISGAVLNADASVSAAHVHDNAIVPILFGLSVSPRALALSSSLRPYLSAAAGPYIHAVSDVYAGGTTSATETVAGARLAAGANWFVARHFLVGVEGNYHAVGKFETPDALTEKPSGFGMSLSFGFAWGGR